MNIVLQLLSTAQSVQKAGQRLFRPHGITVAQFNVLHVLSDVPQGMRASDIARILVVDPSNVTGLLKRMTTDGYLVGIDNNADRRQHVVGLSAKGRRVWSAAAADYQTRLEALEARITKDRKAVARGLETIQSEAASILGGGDAHPAVVPTPES